MYKNSSYKNLKSLTIKEVLQRVSSKTAREVPLSPLLKQHQSLLLLAFVLRRICFFSCVEWVGDGFMGFSFSCKDITFQSRQNNPPRIHENIVDIFVCVDSISVLKKLVNFQICVFIIYYSPNEKI